MNSLYQRLKELDPDTFQKLCFHILRARYPRAGIRSVGGGAGDEGLDQFAGELDNAPVIWQCKSFSGGVGKSQKQQIRESLDRALNRFSPKKRIMCLSTDMDSKAHRWFQQLQRTYRDRVQIELFQGSEIVDELLYYRTIRNEFFPGAGIDVVELKRLAMRTAELTPEELENVTEANAESFIEKLKERDARFNYQLVFGGDQGPIQPTPQPGMIVSIADGKKAINVYARDHEALAADPPQLTLTIKGSGVSKFESLVKHGIPQEFLASELENVATDFAFIRPPKVTDGFKLIVLPRLPNAKTIKSRMTLGSGPDAIEYSLLELEPARIGTDEIELMSKSKLPFTLSVVISLKEGRAPGWKFSTHCVGHKVRDVRKFLRALAVIRSSGQVSLYDLETEAEFLHGRLVLSSPTKDDTVFREFIEDLSAIESRFNVSFSVPSTLSDDDLQTLSYLKAYMNGESLPINNIGIRLIKSEQNKDTVPKLLTGPGTLFLRNENPQAELFGTIINVGPSTISAEGSQVNDLEATLSLFEAAAIGQAVPIVFEPVGPVKFSLAPKTANP